MIDALLGQVRNTALIVGLVDFCGLVLQKKKPKKLFQAQSKPLSVL